MDRAHVLVNKLDNCLPLSSGQRQFHEYQTPMNWILPERVKAPAAGSSHALGGHGMKVLYHFKHLFAIIHTLD